MEAPMSASLGAMGSLLRKLHVLLTPEYQQLIEPVKDGIELLLQNLEVVKAAMVDLSETETPTKMAHHWMNQVRDLSYEIEDYIDNTMYSCSSSGADSESIGGRIGEFGVSVREARERHEIYELGRRTSRFTCASSGQRPGPAPNWKGTKLFGVGSSKTELINKLTDDAVPQFKVVPILGVGGVGKTALAKQVFHELRGRFECRAFVQASRIPDTKRLLRGILSQVRRHSQLPADCCTVQDLIDNIRDHIQDKRYLIVIDDLWETSSWDIVSIAFPKGDDYCRVLTTTNIEEVALECCDYQYYDICKLKPLSRDDSANLFLDTVFGSEQNCSEQLKEISSEIVRNCGGLPLGIISIARLLANEMEDLELWHHVKKFLCFSIATNHTSEDMLRNIVCLSYRNLPRHLKTCLQYLTMYPEGCIMLKADLVKQWSAEGFIRETEGEDTNAVAGSYFDELVSREMVQPIHKAYSDEVFSCTVHHMVFDVIKEISIEENFTTALDYSQSITKLPFKVCRLSLHVSNTKYATKPAHISLSQARSVAFYGLAECLPSALEFKQLRVLILEFWGHQEEYDLREISRLCQLRYVQVTTDMLVQLPATIRGLQYLETLQLDARVANVPSDIVYLQKLLHLRLRDVTNLNIGHMVSLRTLESFDLSNNSEENVWGLGEMTNLQDLHLNYSTELSEHLMRNLTALVSSLGKFGKLRTLTLSLSPSSAAMRMYMDCSNNVSSPPLSVQRLELLPPICIFPRLPEWIGQLKRLCILKIVVRELLSSDVHSLTMLQKLTVLSLDVLQPTEETIVFYHKAFPVLKYFKFRCGVLHLAFQEEAMPNLQKLKIEFNAHRGKQYGDMLIGIEHLLNLQETIGRIGAAMDAEESDKMAAESALSDATNKHSRLSRFNIRRIEWVEEKISQISDVPRRSSSSDEAKKKANEQDATNKPSGTDIVLEDSSFSHEPSGNVLRAYQVEIEQKSKGSVVTSVSSTQRKTENKSQYLSTLLKNPTLDCLRVITDNFSSKREIGRGAFGVVYKGVLDNGDVIAVKKLGRTSGIHARRFQNEANNLLELEHKNVVKLIGSCCQAERQVVEHDGKYVFTDVVEKILCYEYLPNGSLDNYIYDESNGIDWPTRFKIILGICNGLHFLHKERNEAIIHMNLKLSNILLGDNMVPKIADFGLSRIFGQEQTRLITQNVVGWIGYIAPEYYYRGEISEKSDIFSLGILILEIVTGLKNDPQEVSSRILIDNARRNWLKTSQIASKYPSLAADRLLQAKRCIEIALNCVETDPKKRPSVGEIIDKLEYEGTDISGEPIIHEKISPIPQFLSTLPRNPEFKFLEVITNNFSSDREIGRGSFGVVYKGVLPNGELVAVKKLLESVAAVNQDKQFQSEAGILIDLNHKNIVKLIGYCYEIRKEVVENNRKFFFAETTKKLLCYEYLPTGSLDKYIYGQSSELKWDMRFKIIEGICEGLKFLHELKRPIIHLDLKPGNVLLDGNMMPKIADFGLSRLLGEEQTRTRTLTVVGSIGYIAPEYHYSGEISTKSDIFSLGVMIIEIVTGIKVDSSSQDVTSKDFIENIRNNWAKMPQIASNYPLLEANRLQQVKRCIDIALACVDKNPKGRPSIGEIVDRLNWRKG